MLSEYRILLLTEFRRNATRETEWVRHMGGRLWITKHGCQVCAVEPMHQCELIERWEGRSLEEERRRLETIYRRWKAVKAGDHDSAEMELWRLQNCEYGGNGM